MLERVKTEPAVPQTSLAAEHYFDDVVFGLLMKGEGLPYGVGRSVLVEFHAESLPLQLHARLFDLRRRRLRPVIAHPERYMPFWKSPQKEAEAMRRAGGVLLLDVAALDGKYGTKAQRTAEVLVEEDHYYAACSDAHRPDDAQPVGRGIRKLIEMIGDDSARTLLSTRPKTILEGKIFDETYD
jgi:protein-tyrosine phosphatase